MFFILFPVRGSDSDGKWETPPNWPSPFSSSPALQVGVDEWGGYALALFIISCADAYCCLCRVLLNVEGGCSAMQPSWGGDKPG